MDSKADLFFANSLKRNKNLLSFRNRKYA